MKNLLVAVIATCFLVPCTAAIAPAAEGDAAPSPSVGGMDNAVAARINGVEITMGSVATMMRSLGAKGGHEAAPPKSAEEARKEALDQLILQELGYQKAKSEGPAVTRREIDDAMGAMERKLGSGEKLKEFLGKERITEEELRKRIERNILLKRIFTKEILDKAAVPEGEARKTYDNDKESYSRPEKIAVVDVVFFSDPGDADSRKKAEETLKRVHDDMERNPLRLVPDGTFAVRELEIQEGREEGLREAAKRLKAGELSGVFAADGNLHFIKLKEYSARRQFTFEEVKSGIEGKLKAAARKKRLEEWGAELKKDAKIEIMATGSGR